MTQNMNEQIKQIKYVYITFTKCYNMYKELQNILKLNDLLLVFIFC